MKHRILVVEDNVLNLELLWDWLEKGGFTPVAAVNLSEAFAAFVRQPPNAVLLDVQLGPEDGLSLATWIRSDSRFRSLPVIAVTAHAMVTDRQRVMQAGCNACVSKPIDFDELAKHLKLCLSDLSSGS
jgi:two-component system, sensor histidine kinase and response regulator